MVAFAEIVRARSDDDVVGLRFEEQAWSWAQAVQEAADRAAAVADLAPADRQLHIGLLLDNVPDFVFWTFAAALGGHVVVGINPTRRGAELAADIRHTDCDLIISEDRWISLLEGLDLGLPEDRIHSIDTDAYERWLQPSRGAALPETVPDPGLTLLLLFSSGSTGAPKAIICSQGRLGQLAQAMADRVELARESVTYLCMPLYHGNSAMMNLAPATHVGATVGLARRFSASRFAADIHRYGATFVNYVGRALHYVLAQPETPQDRQSTLELAFGTEASVSDVRDFAARFGCRVIEGYGLSEGVVRINRTADTPEDALGVPVGRFDVRVLDEETGKECPPAERDRHGRLLNPEEAIGQIVALGGAVAFEGYYKNPGAQADRVRGEDFWTGDLAYRDHEGWFYFAGRDKDWLRVDGENFSSAPVERILARFDGVRLVQVYAVPDPRTGDQVMCAIQLESGARFDPEAFAAFLERQEDLGTKWAPRFVRLVHDVPMTGSNKVDKTRLRRQAWAVDDEVHWRPDPRALRFAPFTEPDRRAWEERFVEHGRAAALPA